MAFCEAATLVSVRCPRVVDEFVPLNRFAEPRGLLPVEQFPFANSLAGVLEILFPQGVGFRR